MSPMPTLITSGRYDEATPLITETIQRGITGSKWVVFEDSAHLAHVMGQDAIAGSIYRAIKTYRKEIKPTE